MQVPWVVKLQLDAAGVSGLRTASPVVLRPLLRAMARRNAGEGRLPFGSMTPAEASQLLAFCVSDLQLQASPASPGDASGSGAGGAAAGDAARAGAGSNAPPGSQPADVLLEQLMAGVGNLRGMGAALLAGGPPGLAGAAGAAGAAAEQLLGGLLGMAPGGGGGGAAAPAAAAGAQWPPLDAAQLQECIGLPLPTADGTVTVLGAKRGSRGGGLLVYPPGAPCSPARLLPSSCLPQLVAAECLEALGPLLRHPQLRSTLGLTYLGLPQLADSLQAALGPDWASSAGGMLSASSGNAGGVGGSRGAVAAAITSGSGARSGAPPAVAWDEGRAGGPFPDWLRQLWQLAVFLAANAPEWGTVDVAGAARAAEVAHAAAAAAVLGAELVPWERPEAAAAAAAASQWDALASWPLLPLADGRLLRVAHRASVLAVQLPADGSSSSGAALLASSPPPQAAAPPSAVPGADESAEKQGEQRSGWAAALPEPWGWLLPGLASAGAPLLDGRYAQLLAPLCGPPHLEVGVGGAL